MSDNWKLIKEEVDIYRNYVKGLPTAAAAEAKYSFVITKEEIERLLAQKGDGTSLGGLRIVLAAKEIGGSIVPTIHVVAVGDEASHYADYNVPKTWPEDEAKLDTAAPDGNGGGSTGGTVPCPPTCNSTNIFNP